MAHHDRVVTHVADEVQVVRDADQRDAGGGAVTARRPDRDQIADRAGADILVSIAPFQPYPDS